MTDQKPFKTLLITQCRDRLLWYAKYVGCEVPFSRNDGPGESVVWGREPGPYHAENIVYKSDCQIIEHTTEVPMYVPSALAENGIPPAPAPRTLIGELTEDEISCLVEHCSIRESEAVGDRKYLEAEQMKKRGEFFKIALEKSNGRPKSN